MDINISAKHVTVEENVREKAALLVSKFAEEYPNQKISSVRIHFSAERNWQIVEILMNAKNVSLHAAARTDAVITSLTSAFEKIRTQMGRYLQKVRDASVKAEPALKEKIWSSSELKETGDDQDLEGYSHEYQG